VGPAPGTRTVPVDANTINRPVFEIEDSELAPSAGVSPSGVDIRVVLAVHSSVRHVLRSNTSWSPNVLGALAPRFVATDVNETYNPLVAVEGFELAPLPGVVPSGVDIRYVEPVQVVPVTPLHVSRKYT
jgi:hypothetical protein